jgi:hypothetical protein
MTNVTYIIVGLILIIGGALTAFGIPFLKSKLSVD